MHAGWIIRFPEWSRNKRGLDAYQSMQKPAPRRMGRDEYLRILNVSRNRAEMFGDAMNKS